MHEFGRIRLKDSASLGDLYSIGGEGLTALTLWGPRAGEAFTVTDADGRLFRARLAGLDETEGTLLVFEDLGARPSSLEITLLQALPEKERMELIIQKTTELGVSGIVPFKADRSISLEERDSKQKKSKRWQYVALKAAKQCRRDSLVEILPYASYIEAVKSAEGAALKLLLWERTGITMIKEALRGFKDKEVKKVSIISGPEGGLTDEEVKEATGAGFIPVSLGKRILRTETASILSVGLVGYELGD